MARIISRKRLNNRTNKNTLKNISQYKLLDAERDHVIVFT